MKKAKIMLVAIAAFATIGGALAFKARSSKTLFYTLTSGQAATAPITGLSLTGVVTAPNPNTYYYTAVSGNTATITSIFTAQ